MDNCSEGCLLLSLERNAILSLNESARVIWEELEQNPQGLSVSDLVAKTRRQYSSPSVQLKADVELLSEHLTASGFLTATGVGPQRVLKISRGVFHSTQRESLECVTDDCEVEQTIRRNLTDSVLAFSGLILFEIVKSVLGFGRLMSIVKQLPVVSTNKHVAVRTREICESVDRVRLWYPKQIHCLQHSAVVTCLLKIHGIPATLRLGATQRPFYAHAWAEVGGKVVNDSQSVREKYAPFVSAWK
jgi:hypothetical protein